MQEAPRFEVRAVGARQQLPGCPTFVQRALTPERIAQLCLGSCYHPADSRKAIRRIEVVRIRPQGDDRESVGELIEDPWRSFPCPADGSGCQVEFDDPGFSRETVYYVRAIQEPSDAVNGDPLGCSDRAGTPGNAGKPCGTRKDGSPDDCLAPVEERAWSSPIFVDVRP